MLPKHTESIYNIGKISVLPSTTVWFSPHPLLGGSGGNLLHQISLKWVTKYGKHINKIIYVLKYSKTVNEPIFTHPMPARQLAVKNTSMEFHKNMTNGLVIQGHRQMDRRHFHIKKVKLSLSTPHRHTE